MMFRRYFLTTVGLSAIAGPAAYFNFFNPSKTDTPVATASSASQGYVASSPSPSLLANAIPANRAPSGNPSSPLTSAPTASLRSNIQLQPLNSVFNFSVTPEWIIAHWPTVSTGLAQLQLQGYRVPLVSGTTQQDIAGALTYYFNGKQQMQRITFNGTTGDPRPLIGLLSSRFGMTRRLTNDAGVVVYEGVHPNNEPASGMRIRLALVQPGEAYRRFDVELSLERPAE